MWIVGRQLKNKLISKIYLKKRKYFLKMHFKRNKHQFCIISGLTLPFYKK